MQRPIITPVIIRDDIYNERKWNWLFRSNAKWISLSLFLCLFLSFLSSEYSYSAIPRKTGWEYRSDRRDISGVPTFHEILLLYFYFVPSSPAHPLEMETVVVFRQHLLNKRTSIAMAFFSSPAAIGIADCNGPYFLSIHFSSIALCAAHPPLSPFRPSRHPDSLVSAGQKYLRVITSEICATGKQQTQMICHPLIIGWENRTNFRKLMMWLLRSQKHWVSN